MPSCKGPARRLLRNLADSNFTQDSPLLAQSAVPSLMAVLLQWMCEFSNYLIRRRVHDYHRVPSLASSVTDVSPHSVKTRIQLDPVTYNRGLVGGIRQVIANEGAGALLTGFGPTAAGYFLQGAFKFGGYELFKQQFINYLGYESASNNRTAVYLASAATAEFFADIALCPLEATRIRLVSEPTFANGLLGGFSKIARTEGFGGFYSGFGPILFKQ